MLHPLVDHLLAFIELLVLVFEVNEATAEPVDPQTVVVVGILVGCDHLLKELSVLLEISELTLSHFQLHTLFVDALVEFLDRLLVVEGCLVQLPESLVFLLPLGVVLDECLLISGQIGEHFPLLLEKLCLFLV